MKRIDYFAIIIFVLLVIFLLRDNPTSPSGGNGAGATGGSAEGGGGETSITKIKSDSDSVLSSLDTQLDKFAEELADDMNQVEPVDPKVKGFQGKIPDAYVPTSLAPFGTKEKLREDLNYRVNRFVNDAMEEQNAYAKTHDVNGAHKMEYRVMLLRQNAQKKEILDRHKEILKEYQKQTDSQPNLR